MFSQDNDTYYVLTNPVTGKVFKAGGRKVGLYSGKDSARQARRDNGIWDWAVTPVEVSIAA